MHLGRDLLKLQFYRFHGNHEILALPEKSMGVAGSLTGSKTPAPQREPAVLMALQPGHEARGGVGGGERGEQGSQHEGGPQDGCWPPAVQHNHSPPIRGEGQGCMTDSSHNQSAARGGSI